MNYLFDTLVFIKRNNFWTEHQGRKFSITPFPASISIFRPHVIADALAPSEAAVAARKSGTRFRDKTTGSPRCRRVAADNASSLPDSPPGSRTPEPTYLTRKICKPHFLQISCRIFYILLYFIWRFISNARCYRLGAVDVAGSEGRVRWQ